LDVFSKMTSPRRGFYSTIFLILDMKTENFSKVGEKNIISEDSIIRNRKWKFPPLSWR